MERGHHAVSRTGRQSDQRKLLRLSRTEGSGDPGMTRTCDLRFRKPSLYPAELRDREPADEGGIADSIPEPTLDRQPARSRSLRLDVVLAHDLAPGVDLFGEERAEIL